jgi:sugar lactone lactonase YvrE
LVSAATLVVLALSLASSGLRVAYSSSNGESAKVVIGEPDYTSAVNPPASLRTPSNFAFDSSGNLWTADASNNRVIEMKAPAPPSAVTYLVVLGQPSFSSETPSISQAGLYNPSGLALDPTGNLWVTDTSNNRVLEYATPFHSGMNASVVIGQANFVSNTPTATKSGLDFPADVVFDSAGNMWVTDTGNNRVLEFQPPFTTGMSASLVIGQPDYVSNSPATSTVGLNFPTDAAFDSSENLWVADGENNRILEFKAPLTMAMSAILVLGQSAFSTRGAATTQSGLSIPGSLAFDSTGNLWAADTNNNRVLKFLAPFSTGMQAATVLGQPAFTTNSSGTTRTSLGGPTEVGFGPSGYLWVADNLNNRVVVYAPPFAAGAAAYSVVGQADYASSLSQGAQSLRLPQTVSMDASGDLWVADGANNRVVEFSPPFSSGMSASLALGQANLTRGLAGSNQHGLAFPYQVAFDKAGDLWASDYANSRVLEFKPPFSNGMNASVTIGQPSFTATTGAATASGLNGPAGLAFDSGGNLWVSDANNNRVLEFKAPFSTGMSASLVVGQADFLSAQNGTTATTFMSPTDVAFDPSGNLWVDDGLNNRVVEFAAPFSSGMQASTVIGQSSFTTGVRGAGLGGFFIPTSLTFDDAGDLWVTDTGNSRLVGFQPPFSSAMGASIVIGQPNFGPGGPATSQNGLRIPGGATFDGAGNLWVADTANNRVLEFPAPSVSSSTSSSSSTSTSTSSTTSSTSSSSTSTSSTSTSSSSTSSTSSTTSSTTSTSSSTSTSTTSSTSLSSAASTTTTTTTSTTPEFPAGPLFVFAAVLFGAAYFFRRMPLRHHSR